MARRHDVYEAVPELTPEQLAIPIWDVLGDCARCGDGVLLQAVDVERLAVAAAEQIGTLVELAAPQIRAHLMYSVYGSPERVLPDGQRPALLGMLYVLAADMPNKVMGEVGTPGQDHKINRNNATHT